MNEAFDTITENDLVFGGINTTLLRFSIMCHFRRLDTVEHIFPKLRTY